MSCDWQIGDLAVCVAAGAVQCPRSAWMTHSGGNWPSKGVAGRVAAIQAAQPGARTGRHCGCQALVFADGRSGITCRFRKIRPDEQEACEPEFVTLLKRSKLTTVCLSDLLLGESE